jgi:hypothetical protein
VIQVPGLASGSESGSGGSTASGGGAVTLGSPVGNTGGGRISPQPVAASPTVTAAPPPPSPPQTSTTPTEPNAPTQQSHPNNPNPPPEPETPTSGTVVHLNPVAQSYTMATADGEVMPVHADKLPDVGSKVKVPLRQLFNGTFAEKDKRVTKGTADEAKLSGYVSYRDPAARLYSLSIRGASLLVHVPEDGPASIEPPALGTYAEITVDLKRPDQPAEAARRGKARRSRDPASASRGGATGEADCNSGPSSDPAAPPDVELWQSDAKFTLPAAHYVDMEGAVGAICSDPSGITLPADDAGESGQDIGFAAPAPIDVSKLDVGEPIDVTAELGDDGSYTVTGLTSDDGVKGASDRSAAQGDQAP